MSLPIGIVIALLLLVLLLIGARRDLRRGVMALGGTLLGAILSGFWGGPLGMALAVRADIDPALAVLIADVSLLLVAALLIGYGGAVLLSANWEAVGWSERFVGGMLGLLNGIILTGYLLRFATQASPSFAASVATTWIARIIHDGLPLLWLTITLAAAAAVIGKSLLQLNHRSVGSAREWTPLSSTPVSREERRANRRRALDRINDAVDRINGE